MFDRMGTWDITDNVIETCGRLVKGHDEDIRGIRAHPEVLSNACI